MLFVRIGTGPEQCCPLPGGRRIPTPRESARTGDREFDIVMVRFGDLANDAAAVAGTAYVTQRTSPRGVVGE